MVEVILMMMTYQIRIIKINKVEEEQQQLEVDEEEINKKIKLKINHNKISKVKNNGQKRK